MTGLVEELRFYAAKQKWPKGLDGMPDLLARAADAVATKEALPWSVKDIQRGLILFRTSNNSQGYTNFSSLSAKVDGLPQIAKNELATIMRSIASDLSPQVYTVGDNTMRRVFEPSGMKDVSDLQAVFNAVEAALSTDADTVELPYHCDVCTTPGYGDAPCSPLCDRLPLSAQVPDLAIPDGWKLVPADPNDNWAERYCGLTNKHPDGMQTTSSHDGWVSSTFRDISKREISAMLAAAPAIKEGQ